MSKQSQRAARHQPGPQGRKGRGKTAGQHARPFTSSSEAPNEITQPGRWNDIFGSFPDGVVVSDRHGLILYANPAVRQLFEVSTGVLGAGADYQQFLRRYEIDAHHHPVSSPGWFTDLIRSAGEPEHRTSEFFEITLPSGRTAYLRLTSSPMVDARRQLVGVLTLFHEVTPCYEKARHLQRVQNAVMMFLEAIAHVPLEGDIALPEETSLLSPPALFVAQQLVEVIRHVLDCTQVWLTALGPLSGRMYFVASSGFTREQEAFHLQWRGRSVLSEYLDEAAIARLHLGREVIISTDSVSYPPGYQRSIDKAKVLGVPLFTSQRLTGVLIVAKQGVDSTYTQEEIDLVRVVAEQTNLVIDCLRVLQMQTEKHSTALVLNEMHRLSNEFLTLASHELRTPLTGIMGNIQVAQRRLERLKRQIEQQSNEVKDSLEAAQEPLAFASESARLQQRMINAMIDDARIQARTLLLYNKPLDLLALVRECIAEQQKPASQSTIILETRTLGDEVTVFADAERLKQVLRTYLENAQRSSPDGQPITVQLVVENRVVRVSVRDEGAGISLEEQERLWERFYRARGSAVQQELDLSLGLGFYLCRALIELHRGHVGVQSIPGHGATFWFTLPIVSPPADEGR
ncbi:MAG TPA: ATP-binding protein [Ktedonobacteraceae bacterium]|nr:ATP-binding protein [Ktedonobacteraceae bacterium]